MATRKFRKLKPRKTVRRRKFSTAGKILPPLDVRSKNHLKEFEKRVKSGDLTIILVWAPWCPHCHTIMPHFDAATKSPNRSIQAIKVQDNMLEDVNQVLTRSINKQAKPLNVEGYPSIIVVDKKGNKVTDIEPVRNTKSMTSLMDNAGPLAIEAGLNSVNQDKTSIANSIKNSLKNVKPLSNNVNTNNGLMTNLGIEQDGLVSGSPKNIDLGEDELKGSLGNKNIKNKNIKLNSINSNELENTNINNVKPKKVISMENIAPSPINSFNSEKLSMSNPPSADLKKLSQEAEEVTLLEAPLSPPSINEDIETESISNSLTAEQKVSGGGKKGGSMMAAMTRTSYTLAPVAALLATATLVMRGKHGKTHKRSKKNRRSNKRR